MEDDITLEYHGTRRILRTVSIATGAGETLETTSEFYDFLGRLEGVDEAGSSGAVATYTYDVGGRLIGVELKGAAPS